MGGGGEAVVKAPFLPSYQGDGKCSPHIGHVQMAWNCGYTRELILINISGLLDHPL